MFLTHLTGEGVVAVLKLPPQPVILKLFLKATRELQVVNVSFMLTGRKMTYQRHLSRRVKSSAKKKAKMRLV